MVQGPEYNGIIKKMTHKEQLRQLYAVYNQL